RFCISFPCTVTKKPTMLESRRHLVLGLSTFVTFLWAWKFDSVQISDFGVYFRCGAEISQDIEKWVDDCQSNYLHKNLIYWGRSLLYTTPLASLTGADYPALKLYNATLHTVTMFVWFFGLRQYYGPRIALASTLLLLLYPEWWFTITLATTDNAALLCVVAFILLLPKLNRCARGGLIIIGLSLILFAANLLRAVGPILMLAILFWALFKQCTRREPYLIVHILYVLVLYAFLNWLLGRVTPSTASDPLQFLKVFSLIDFGSTQDFGSNYVWGEHFWFSIPEEWRASVAFRKIFLEVVNGFYQWPLYLYHKASMLFNGSGYYSFSSSLHTGFNPDTIFTVPLSTVPFSATVFPLLAAIVFFYLVLATWAILRVRLTGPDLVAAIWLGAFSLVILGLGETQPRYSVLVAPALSLLAAIALFRREEPTAKQHPGFSNTSTLNTSRGFLLIAALFGTTVFGLYIIKSAIPNPMLRATQSSYVDHGFSECEYQSAKLESTYKRLRIVTPKGTKCASVNLPLSKAVTAISFFVSGSNFPFLWESPIRSTFRYRVEINDRVFLNTSLDNESTRWHLLDLNHYEVNDASQVRLAIIRDDIEKDEFIDFSLYTEIKK
ncbi:MAG: hypothetical protein ABIV42_06825, partial [Nitrosospira sp.]